jgi:hypothetical protein
MVLHQQCSSKRCCASANHSLLPKPRELLYEQLFTCNPVDPTLHPSQHCEEALINIIQGIARRRATQWQQGNFNEDWITGVIGEQYGFTRVVGEQIGFTGVAGEVIGFAGVVGSLTRRDWRCSQGAEDAIFARPHGASIQSLALSMALRSTYTSASMAEFSGKPHKAIHAP